MSYHLTGTISALIFLLTLGGLWAQLGWVWTRQRDFAGGRLAGERPTAVLSLNQFVSSFLAFFSFFLYGACLPRFNHYLVWPRLAAALLTLVVLYEMMADRRDALGTMAFFAGLVMLLCAPILLWTEPELVAGARVFSQGLVVVVTVILAQGYSHQIVLIRRTGRTGAVSLRFHQFFFLKDISTIAFALTMGGGRRLAVVADVERERVDQAGDAVAFSLGTAEGAATGMNRRRGALGRVFREPGPMEPQEVDRFCGPPGVKFSVFPDVAPQSPAQIPAPAATNSSSQNTTCTTRPSSANNSVTRSPTAVDGWPRPGNAAFPA